MRARPSVHGFSRPSLGSFALRPGDLLAILKMALSIGFRSSLSFPPAIQATGPLTLAPVGLSPTERASVCWTRIPISCSTNHQSKCANWEPAAAGPTAATSAPAAHLSQQRRKPCRHPSCHSKPPPKPSTFWTPSFPGCAGRKGNSPESAGARAPALRERSNTSDARGDQPGPRFRFRQRTRTGCGVEFGFPPGGCAHLPRGGSTRGALRFAPRHQDTCDHLGKKPETLPRFPKPNGIAGSPTRSRGGSLFLAVAAASVHLWLAGTAGGGFLSTLSPLPGLVSGPI